MVRSAADQQFASSPNASRHASPSPSASQGEQLAPPFYPLEQPARLAFQRLHQAFTQQFQQLRHNGNATLTQQDSWSQRLAGVEQRLHLLKTPECLLLFQQIADTAFDVLQYTGTTGATRPALLNSLRALERQVAELERRHNKPAPIRRSTRVRKPSVSVLPAPSRAASPMTAVEDVTSVERHSPQRLLPTNEISAGSSPITELDELESDQLNSNASSPAASRRTSTVALCDALQRPAVQRASIDRAESPALSQRSSSSASVAQSRPGGASQEMVAVASVTSNTQQSSVVPIPSPALERANSPTTEFHATTTYPRNTFSPAFPTESLAQPFIDALCLLQSAQEDTFLVSENVFFAQYYLGLHGVLHGRPAPFQIRTSNGWVVESPPSDSTSAGAKTMGDFLRTQLEDLSLLYGNKLSEEVVLMLPKGAVAFGRRMFSQQHAFTLPTMTHKILQNVLGHQSTREAKQWSLQTLGLALNYFLHDPMPTEIRFLREHALAGLERSSATGEQHRLLLGTSTMFVYLEIRQDAEARFLTEFGRAASGEDGRFDEQFAKTCLNEQTFLHTIFDLKCFQLVTLAEAKWSAGFLNRAGLLPSAP